MSKDLRHVRQEHLRRVIIGTHFEKVVNREKWVEYGHILKGATFAAERLTEVDGAKQVRGSVGSIVTADWEWLQNRLSDIRMQMVVGRINLALVTGPDDDALPQVLRIFRLHYLGGNRWEDNRVSVKPTDGYGDWMDKTKFSVPGVWVPNYEIYSVKNIRVVAGRLKYDELTPSKSDPNADFIDNRT